MRSRTPRPQSSSKLVWFNGKEAFTYWEPDRYEKEESLSLAVAGASGASSRTASTVLDLLLPGEFRTSTLDGLVKVSLLGEEVFEGVRCYRITATEVDDPIELWVGKNARYNRGTVARADVRYSRSQKSDLDDS